MSFLYGLLITVYIFLNLFLMLIILVQKSKSSMGLGSLGGGSQMLFGGTGGQDIFQKITWGLGFAFMGLSLVLSLLKAKEVQQFRYVKASTTVTRPAPLPSAPQAPTQSAN